MNAIIIVLVVGIVSFFLLALLHGLCVVSDDGDDYDNTPRF